MTDRRSFVAWLGTLATALRWPRAASLTDPGGRTTPVVRATPTVLYRQPDGRSNLVPPPAAGLHAPAARAPLTDRRRGVGLRGRVFVEAARGLGAAGRRGRPLVRSRASAAWGTRRR